MNDRPILFSGPMVRAIVDGRKTMTRRLVKRGHVFRTLPGGDLNSDDRRDLNAIPFRWERDNPAHPSMDELLSCCPYGKPGDRLWVRESVWVSCCKARWSYVADSAIPEAWAFKKLPSIHMPRRMSRLYLEITSVRVEAVIDITEEDARAEGMMRFTKDGDVMKWWPCDPCEGPWKCAWKELPRTARDAFLHLFTTINNRGGEGCLVWVVEFRRIEP